MSWWKAVFLSNVLVKYTHMVVLLSLLGVSNLLFETFHLNGSQRILEVG